jgi:hypothetical protein
MAYLDSEIDKKFETYRLYLLNICKYLISTYSEWRIFGDFVNEKFSTLQPLRTTEVNYIERFLKLAWNTEYIACRELIDDISIIRINNHWKLIQIYYSIYSAGEALSYLIDGQKSDSHIRCLRKISDFLIRRKISPWDLAFTGCKREGYKPINFPCNLKIPHNLKRNVNPIESIAACLKAEHPHRIKETFKKNPGKFQIDHDPGPTTILHLSYRLRIKSNYKDADIFIIDSPPDEYIIEFSKNLSQLCFWTLLLFELIIIKRWNKTKLIELINKYLSLNQDAQQLITRRDYYNAI